MKKEMVCLSVQEFLDSTTGNTKKTYQIGLKIFFEWYNLKERVNSLEDILELRKEDLTQKPNENIVDYRFRAQRFERELEKFFNYLIEKGQTANTAKTRLQGVKALFSYYAMPIKLRRGLKANRPEKTERNFPLTIEHVRRMFQVANLRDKVILSMATDLGWRIGDFKNIQIIDLPNLEQESPISFERKTQKCRIIAYGFISAESVDVLRLYLKELEDRKNRHAKANPYLFPSKGNRHANHHLSDEAFSKILKRLIRQARIDTNGKKVTFHCFRKMLLSAAINSGVGLVVGKKLIGKKIGFSDDTYLTDLALRQKFIQLKKFLTIRQTAKPENEGDIENLKFVVTKLHEDLTRERTITKAVTEKNMKITRDIEEMKKQIAEFQAFTEFLRSLGITNDSIAKLALEKMHKEE